MKPLRTADRRPYQEARNKHVNGGGKVGHVGGLSAFASDVERIVVNQTNPDPALGDDRSEYLGSANPHPFLTFTPIPQAMSMSIDRPRWGFSAGRRHGPLHHRGRWMRT